MPFDDFKALDINSRAQVFLAWLKAQPPTKKYLPDDIENCALAQFGKRFMPMAQGGAFSFFVHQDPVSVYPKDSYPHHCPLWDSTYASRSTFGEFAERLEVYLVQFAP